MLRRDSMRRQADSFKLYTYEKVALPHPDLERFGLLPRL
jgi:hypothetical protein